MQFSIQHEIFRKALSPMSEREILVLCSILLEKIKTSSRIFHHYIKMALQLYKVCLGIALFLLQKCRYRRDKMKV